MNVSFTCFGSGRSFLFFIANAVTKSEMKIKNFLLVAFAMVKENNTIIGCSDFQKAVRQFETSLSSTWNILGAKILIYIYIF